MPKFNDLTGQKFGRWLVIGRVEDSVTASGFHYTQYECICECGTKRNVLASSLRNGSSKSCGCLNREDKVAVCRNNFRTHGDSKTRLYGIYAGIKKRCYNSSSYNYDLYGGRGITMCDEWLDSWESFKNWAMQNGYSDTMSIDRIDVNGNYEPSNCRWVGRVAQANNRRCSKYITCNNETHTMAEWAKILDIPYKNLWKKIKNGKSLEEIMAN